VAAFHASLPLTGLSNAFDRFAALAQPRSYNPRISEGGCWTLI